MNPVFIDNHVSIRCAELSERHDLFSPVPGRESFEVDNAGLAPEEVARLTIGHYHLPSA